MQADCIGYDGSGYGGVGQNGDCGRGSNANEILVAFSNSKFGQYYADLDLVTNHYQDFLEDPSENNMDKLQSSIYQARADKLDGLNNTPLNKRTDSMEEYPDILGGGPVAAVGYGGSDFVQPVAVVPRDSDGINPSVYKYIDEKLPPGNTGRKNGGEFIE